MQAVFGKQRVELGSPLSPGVKRKNDHSLTPEEEDYVARQLEALYSSLPRRSRAYVTEHYFGGGANGIGYVEAMTHQLATDGEVTVFFKGELANSPADDLEQYKDSAQYVLQQYKDSWQHDSLTEDSPVMESLAKLEGPWAFIIYDRMHGRIIAARDPAAAEPLYWGTTLLSEGLLFASDRALIEGECADADHFPSGALFVSNDGETVGNLVPIRSEAPQPRESLCRVESSSGLHKVASSSGIAAS